MNRKDTRHFFIFARAILLFTTIGIILIAIYGTLRYAYPFLIAFLLAWIMNPAIEWLKKRLGFHRLTAVFFIMVGFLGVLGFLLFVTVSEMISGTSYLISVLPPHIDRLIANVNDIILNVYTLIEAQLHSLNNDQQDWIENQLVQLLDNIGEAVKTVVQGTLVLIPGLLSFVPNTAVVLICILLGTFFISKDWPRVTGWIKRMCPPLWQRSWSSILQTFKHSFNGFIKAQFILVSISTVIVWLGLTFLNIDYALTIALLIGMVDLLPYAGTGLVFLPWMIYLFFQARYEAVIGLAILYGIIIISRQLLEPKILSSQIGIHPLSTLISMFVLFQWIGVAGLFLGPFVIVAFRALHEAGLFKEAWNYITRSD
ncbi:sporulation integral membrane protein YtvI [Bacillaceae bacterium SIJ1]|uniref:sporulation integral membrane protein YtvI n=1 Tax=Litoribacterium kuwaitense TaxID=1398745 RepID=UPI0013ED811C|nr:sporulation integral membrane protein YtvI [Litoribacterium kuwaitense]NGP45027.1 sporulation integral membrane protein YtvI [Litoribacterium kuwaitense]